MTLAAWHEEAIGKKHNRNAFDCGADALNPFRTGPGPDVEHRDRVADELVLYYLDE